MAHYLAELYTPKPAWLDLSESERQDPDGVRAFFNGVFDAVSEAGRDIAGVRAGTTVFNILGVARPSGLKSGGVWRDTHFAEVFTPTGEPVEIVIRSQK